MKKSLFAVGVLMLLLQIPVEVRACGDKFLVKHGTLSKARCMAGLKTGSILIFREPDTKAVGNALGKDLERTLVNSGNTVIVVESLEEFEGVLRRQEFDVVLSGYLSAQAAEKTLKTTGKHTKFIPVVERENETMVNAAKERFGSVIKDTDRTSTKTLIINEVLSAAAKTS